MHMLAEPKLNILLNLVKTSNREELIWMNGYLAGLLAAQGTELPSLPGLASIANEVKSIQTETAPAAAPAPAKPTISKITIAYGTETGNSKKLAADFATQAKKAGITVKLVSLEQYRLTDLPKEEYFFTIISTQGEGEPPTTAKKFYDHIHQNGFKLNQLKFGVLALGDTSYPLFCKAGEDVDTQLQRLGGQRIVSLVKCDVDYETEAGTWFSQVIQHLNTPATSNGAAVTAAPAVVKKPAGKKIYTGNILTNINLNDKGSQKETYHIEISTEEELDYQPGDSIGIIPENPLQVVEAIIHLTGIDRERKLAFRNEQYSVFDLLHKKLNIVYLPERNVKQYAAIVKQDIPETKIGLLDLLKIYPVKDAQQFEEVIGILESITPRLYSISSSPTAHSGEVHVTVARDTFCVNDEWKFGLCSDFLRRLPVDSTVEFYIQKNNQFRLPAPDKDVIMIGPGTGVAPFRSFLAERDATGASGRNWLFFGEQYFVTDFLYQTELQNWAQTGVLSKVSLAFSRDQHYKIYVQHRIIEQGREVWEWLNSGAYVYVCGAKDPMYRDVEYTILQVIERFGGYNSHEALHFLDQLKEEGRFHKDVY